MNPQAMKSRLLSADNTISDPGNGKSISVDKSDGMCLLVSATTETRSLPAPVRAGVRFNASMKTDGGDIVLTFTGGALGLTNNAITTATFDDVYDTIACLAVLSGTTFKWMVLSAPGVSLA